MVFALSLFVKTLNMGYLELVSAFLDSNFFQTLALIIVGTWTFRVYKRQKEDQVHNAALLLKLEIDSIEGSIGKLKLKKNSEDIFQSTPIYQQIDWYRIRSLLVSKMDVSYVNALNTFFESAVNIEEARLAFKNAILANRDSKIQSTQADVSKILSDQLHELYKPLNRNELTSQPMFNPLNVEERQTVDLFLKSKLTQFQYFYENHFCDFHSNSVRWYYDNSLNTYTKLSNTPTYDCIVRLIQNQK